MTDTADIAIIGAGAAGLMAAIAAGRAAKPGSTILALDGAAKLGAKILVAGGGRCNVTHYAVDESAYAGSSRNSIRNALRAFTVEDTISFFADRGVALKKEETGKLFPTTDDAHTILDALLFAARKANVQLIHPWRVEAVEARNDGFLITPADRANAPIHAARLILATGGMALPRSGSDGHGYTIARSLGHSITRTFPALVPIILHDNSFVRTLSGLTLNTTLTVSSSTGKKLAAFTNSTLCTHFGLSGPGPLDISRYFFDALHTDPGARFTINWTPHLTSEALDQLLIARRGISPAKLLAAPPVNLSDRHARALCEHAEVPPTQTTEHLSKDRRRALVQAVTNMTLPVTGSRGFTYAEVTAGGVPLAEVHTGSMQSRLNPNLYLCGEILDVDGRIGGFNFQWAWATGHLAGSNAARADLPSTP